MNNNQLVTIVVIVGLLIALAVTCYIFYKKIKISLEEAKRSDLADLETGLYDAEFFLGLINKSIETFERYQSPFTLLIFNFRISKTVALATRRDAVHKIGQHVSGAIRQSDQAGRLSDDAIGVLLYSTNAKNSQVVENRIVAIFKKILPDVNVRATAWTAPAEIGLIRMFVNPTAGNLATESAETAPETEPET